MKFNLEQNEATQAEVNKKLQEFKESLPERLKTGMDKIQEVTKYCENNGIPIIVFAKFMPSGFHQWNSLMELETDNMDRYSPDYPAKSWNLLGEMCSSMLNFTSKSYGVHVRAFNKIKKYLVFDSDPDILEDEKS